MRPTSGATSTATSSTGASDEAPLALDERPLVQLLDGQRHATQRQPAPLDELVEAGGLPAEGVEHLMLVGAETRSAGAPRSWPPSGALGVRAPPRWRRPELVTGDRARRPPACPARWGLAGKRPSAPSTSSGPRAGPQPSKIRRWGPAETGERTEPGTASTGISRPIASSAVIIDPPCSGDSTTTTARDSAAMIRLRDGNRQGSGTTPGGASDKRRPRSATCSQRRVWALG